MSTYNDPEQIRKAAQGFVAEKTAAVPASGSTDDLFTIDGGAVQILDLVGIVETALVANTDLSTQFDPDDGGTDVDLSDSATPLVADSDATGTIYTHGATVGADLVATLDVVAKSAIFPLTIADSGDIKLTSAGGGAGGGSIHWYCVWLPLEQGATVTAAA